MSSEQRVSASGRLQVTHTGFGFRAAEFAGHEWGMGRGGVGGFTALTASQSRRAALWTVAVGDSVRRPVPAFDH